MNIEISISFYYISLMIIRLLSLIIEFNQMYNLILIAATKMLFLIDLQKQTSPYNIVYIKKTQDLIIDFIIHHPKLKNNKILPIQNNDINLEPCQIEFRLGSQQQMASILERSLSEEYPSLSNINSYIPKLKNYSNIYLQGVTSQVISIPFFSLTHLHYNK